jgi:hypothetical protein
MFRTLTIAIVSALMLGTASAAMAQPQHSWRYYSCQTDDGYGRTSPCDGGGS